MNSCKSVPVRQSLSAKGESATLPYGVHLGSQLFKYGASRVSGKTLVHGVHATHTVLDDIPRRSLHHTGSQLPIDFALIKHKR